MSHVSHVGAKQPSRTPSACRHGRTPPTHSSICTGTRHLEAPVQETCCCVAAKDSRHVYSGIWCHDKGRPLRYTACSASSSKGHTGVQTDPAPGRSGKQHTVTKTHKPAQQHHLQQQLLHWQTDSGQHPWDHHQHQHPDQQPAVAARSGHQQVAAEQQRLITALVDVTATGNNTSLQQQLASWILHWCCCMQPYLQDLPLPALATVGVCLDLHQQRQQTQQNAIPHRPEGQHMVSAKEQQQQCESQLLPRMVDPGFLHAYCLAAETAAAAAVASSAVSIELGSPYRQQWELVHRLWQQRQGQQHQGNSTHQQQQLQAVSVIISWATQQLIQQQRHHWQQQRGQQQHQHAQQVQLHLQVRNHLLQVLQAATSPRLLPAATAQILQELLVCYGRLGIPVDESWMGRWLAAARYVISDVTVPFRAQQGAGSDLQQHAAAVYGELTGLLHGLAVAKVTPPESWLSVWQEAAVLVIQAKPDFTGRPAVPAAAAGDDGRFLISVQQLLHAVSYLKVKLSAEYWKAHEGLVQQQLLQFSPQQLLLLIQLHQQYLLKPSTVCVKYMAAQLAQHIHKAWQQQQQQQGLLPGDSAVGDQLLAVCMCVCGLAAWGVRLNMTSTCELLVCLAAQRQLLPLPGLIQLLFTLGPRLGLVSSNTAARDIIIISSSSSASSVEQGCQAQQPAAAGAAAAVLELLEYAAYRLASQQRWQQSSSIAAGCSSIRQLHQLLQLAAHLPRNTLHNTPLLSHLDDLAAAAAPVCQIADLIQIMTHWTHLGFSSAWRHGGLRRGYRRLGQPGALRALRNADLVTAAVAAAKLPPLQRVIWQLTGEVSARLAANTDAGSQQQQLLGDDKAQQQQQQQQQGFTPVQLVDLVSAVPAVAAFWPPDEVLLLLQHIEGLEQHRLLNPADQWRVWSALQQLQQHWRPAVAAAGATARSSMATARPSSSSSSSDIVAAAPVHVNLQSSAVPDVAEQPAAAADTVDVSSDSSTGSSTLDREYHLQQRQQQQELVSLLERLQQQVAATLSNAAPVVLPVDAVPARITPAVWKIKQSVTNNIQIPAAWAQERQQLQQQGELTIEQLLQHLAKAHRALQSPKCTPADLTRVCEGLARLLAVLRFSRALSKVPTARDGVLRALQATAWPDLDAKTLDGHQLLLLIRVSYALGCSDDRPYLQQLSQTCVETLTALPAKDLAAVLGRTAAVHVSGFCKCWEVVLLRIWVGRVQQLAVQNPEEAVGVIVPLVKLGFKPAPAAAALVLLPLLRTTAAAATAAVTESSSSTADESMDQPCTEGQGQDSAIASSSKSDDIQMQQQQQQSPATFGALLSVTTSELSVASPASSAVAAATNSLTLGSSGSAYQSTGQQSCELQGQEVITLGASSTSSSTEQQLRQQQQQEGSSTVVARPPASSLAESATILSSSSAAAADGSSGGPQGLSAKGIVLLTRVLVDLNLKPEPSTADLLLLCQINCLRSCSTAQLIQLAHYDLHLGLLGGPVRGLGMWGGQGVLPGRVVIWVKTWLSWVNRSFKVMSASQAVETQMLLSEIELLPLHRTKHSSQALEDICRLQQQLHTVAAAAGSSSSSSQLHDSQHALSAAVQASYQTNRADRQTAAAAVARRERKKYAIAAAIAAAAADGDATDLDSDDEYSSASASATTSSSSSSSGGIIRVGGASNSSSMLARRSAVAAAVAAGSDAGFSYPSDAKAMRLYQLQQQRCALLWAAVKFRLVTADVQWMTRCLSVFQRRLNGLPPAVVLGLLNAATEVASSSRSSSCSSIERDVIREPSPVTHLVFSNIWWRVADHLLEHVLSSWVAVDLLAPAVSGLAAYAAASLAWRRQQQHWWLAGEQPDVFQLTQQQRRRLQTVVLRQLPYIQAGQLSGLIRAMASLPVKPDSSLSQPETVRPSPHFLARACQVLAMRATSAGAAGDPTQQLLLLAAAQQLMALQPADAVGIPGADDELADTVDLGQGVISASVNASSSLHPAAQKAGSGAEVSPVAPSPSPQGPSPDPAGVGHLVTRALGAAGLQVLASLVHRLGGNTQQQQQQQQQWQHRRRQSEPSTATPVGTTLSGLAAQMMAWSKAVQRQRRAPAAATAVFDASTEQQRQLANIAMVLGMAGVGGSSGSASVQQQQQQLGFSGPGQQQLLGMLLRVELQQALRPQLSAAAQVCQDAAAAAAENGCSGQLVPATAVDVAKVPRRVAARGLQLKFDGLLRWAFRAAAAGAAAATPADLGSSSSSRSIEYDGSRSESQLPAVGSDASSRSRRSSSSSDSTVVVLPVMSRALDVQFARLLRQVLQYNMTPQGRAD